MSQRLDQTFARLKAAHEGALVTFITAGDPVMDGTPALVAALAEAGADIVELGIPYSDPLADGPSIQASSQRALDSGVTPDTVCKWSGTSAHETAGAACPDDLVQPRAASTAWSGSHESFPKRARTAPS